MFTTHPFRILVSFNTHKKNKLKTAVRLARTSKIIRKYRLRVVIHQKKKKLPKIIRKYEKYILIMQKCE